MEDFGEVSLGFAEFVSQLLQETFDATLSAQSYQLEKISELESSLNLPNERFREMYLSEDMLLEKELDIFGAKLINQMELSSDVMDIIEGLFDDTSSIVIAGKLTNEGLNKLQAYVLESLVAERKNALRGLINKTEMTRLMVDSGEIRAKLELTNLSQNLAAQGGNTDSKSLRKSKESVTDKTPAKEPNKASIDELSSAYVSLKGIKMREIIDPETNRKTLIVDKESISNKLNIDFSMPSVRIVAKPASVSSSSNLFSEVIIKFKTI